MALKRAGCEILYRQRYCLGSFSTNSAGELDVLWHDGYTLGVDCAKVGVFKETDEVSFAGFLEGHDGRALESEISLEVLSDFTDQALEGQFSDEKFSALLVPSDFSQSDCTWSVTMGFFDTSSGRGALASSLCGQLFTWCLTTSGFSCGLLCTCHCE